MKHILAISLMMVGHLCLTAQLQGGVFDSAGEPLTGAHIWLSGTSMGTLAAEDGSFTLDPPPGRYTIIVSFLGYAAFQQDILMTLGAPRDVKVTLTQDEITLSEVTIEANASKKRKRWLNQFAKGFFGYTSNAKHCVITNPDVLLFEEDGAQLKAMATNLIEIENRALGYRILFLLEEAVMQGAAIRYHGKPLFEELEAKDDNEARKWEKAREKSYEGSLRHFLRALAANHLGREGFDIHHSLPQGTELHDLGPAKVSRIVRQHATEPDVLLLSFDGFLKVTYLREKNTVQWQGKNALGNVAGSLGHRSEKSILQNDMREMTRSSDDQVTYLFLKKSPIMFDTEGNVIESQYLEEHGYLGHERIADMLPLEYENH